MFVYGEEKEKAKCRERLPDQNDQEVFKACSVLTERTPVENQITFIVLKTFRAKYLSILVISQSFRCDQIFHFYIFVIKLCLKLAFVDFETSMRKICS